MSGVWRLLRLLKERVSGPGKEYVGIDHLGNKYYRIPQHETWAGQNIKEKRFVEAVNISEYQYEAGVIPTEWEAWMKKRRDPPTIEECIHNQKYKENMKKKIEDLEEQTRLVEAKDYEDDLGAGPLRIQSKGHASASHYGKAEHSEEPVSTANTFQPGTWRPPTPNK